MWIYIYIWIPKTYSAYKVSGTILVIASYCNWYWNFLEAINQWSNCLLWMDFSGNYIAKSMMKLWLGYASPMMMSSSGNIFRVTFMTGIHRLPMNSPHKGQWCGTLMFPLICTWINAGANTWDAGDLRSHRAHYDVIVILGESLWG